MRRIVWVLIACLPLGMVALVVVMGCGQTSKVADELSEKEERKRRRYVDNLIHQGKTTKTEEDRDSDGKPDLIKHYYDNELIKVEELPYRVSIKDHPLKGIKLEAITRIEYHGDYGGPSFITTNDQEITNIYNSIVNKSYTFTWSETKYVGVGSLVRGSGFGPCESGLALYFMRGKETLMKINGNHTGNTFFVRSSESPNFYNDKLGEVLTAIIKRYKKEE